MSHMRKRYRTACHEIMTMGPCGFTNVIGLFTLCLDHGPTHDICPLLLDGCYALAGALRATCAKAILPSQLMTWWDKVLGVRSVDIAQHSKAPG